MRSSPSTRPRSMNARVYTHKPRMNGWWGDGITGSKISTLSGSTSAACRMSPAIIVLMTLYVRTPSILVLCYSILFRPIQSWSGLEINFRRKSTMSAIHLLFNGGPFVELSATTILAAKRLTDPFEGVNSTAAENRDDPRFIQSIKCVVANSFHSHIS